MKVSATVGGLQRAAWDYLQELRKQSTREADRQLSDGLSQMVERYHAASAWLYYYAPDRPLASGLPPIEDPYPLKLAAYHNAPAKRALAKTGTMAGKCVDTGRPLVYSVIINMHGRTNRQEAFVAVKPNTRSAMAVPLFGNSYRAMAVGALVIESHLPHSFSQADAYEAAAEAESFAPALLYLRELAASRMRHFAWYLPLWDWNITRVLNGLCHGVTNAVARDAGVSSIGMTIWKADFDSKCAFALGAARFDSDYLQQRTIPIFADRAGKLEALSFVGSLILAEPNVCVDNAVSDEHRFRRVEKAARMEVEHIYGVPIDRYEDDGSVSSSPAARNGAITFYTFRGAHDAVKHELQHARLRRLASIVSRFLRESSDLGAALVIGMLYGRLAGEAMTGVNSFNIIRDVLMDVFDADGCSIFDNTVDEQGRMLLECVTTSGIIAEGKEQLRDQVFYTIPSNAAESPHRTERLAVEPGRIIRENQGFPGGTAGISPTRRLIEAFTLSEHEHRRVLFYSVPERAFDADPEGKAKAVGVIRIVRSIRKRPFSPEDGELLRKVGDIVRDALEFRHEELRRYRAVDGSTILGEVIDWATSRIEDLLKGVLSEKALEKRVDECKEGLTRALRRVLSDCPGFVKWSRRQIDAILQDVFYVCRVAGPVLVLLRTVERNRSPEDALRLHAYHGHVFLQGPEEGAGDPIREIEGGIGWDAMQSGRLIAFTSEDPKYTHLFREVTREARRGLCLAIVLPFAAGPMRASISLEWRGDREDDLRPLTLLLLASAWKIGRAALDQRLVAEYSGLSVGLPMTAADASQAFGQWLMPAGWSNIVTVWGIEMESPNSAEVPGERQGAWSEEDLDLCRALRRDPSEFSPLKVAAWFVRRELIDLGCDIPGSDKDRFFGRLDPEDEQLVAELSLLGVAIDVRSGMFILPLWSITARCGWFVGKSALCQIAERHSATAEFRQLLNEMRDLISRWMHFQAAKSKTVEDWAILLKEENPSIPGRREWSVVCTPGSGGIRPQES